MSLERHPGLVQSQRRARRIARVFAKEEVDHAPRLLYLAYNAGLPSYQTPDMDPSRWQAAWDVNQATRADLVAMVESMDRGIGLVLAVRIGPWKLVVDGETQLLFHLDTDLGSGTTCFASSPT